MPLTGSADVAAIYATGTGTKPTADDSVWTISAATFTTPAQARAATVALVKAQVSCPAVQTDKTGAVTETLTRTVSAPDTSEKGLWKGYRTVSHLTESSSTKSARIMDTYFERGNVIVKVQEVAPITADSGPQQDALRKAVTVATLQKLDAIS